MKLKNLSYQKKSLLALGLVMAFIGISASLMMIFNFRNLSENENMDVAESSASLAAVDFKKYSKEYASEYASTTIPVQIMIPKIALTAKLEYVGLTPSGAMGTPKNPVN